jgi:hypothetical protein
MPAEIVEKPEEAPAPAKAELMADATDEALDSVITGELPEGESEPNTPDEVPDKYRGKTQRELIEMHQNAEKQMGKHSQEVGELRQVVDTFIKTQMAAQTQQDDTDDADELPDFHLEPEAAVAAAVDKHPAVKEAKRNNEEYRRATSLAQLAAKHPDMREIMADPQFAEYVKASPTRMRLYAEADQQYNFESADELLTSFKERKAVVAEAASSEAGARKEAVKAASTGSAKASSAPASRKVYRRADIIRLMQTDPSRYEAMQPEIMAAYREGRVK